MPVWLYGFFCCVFLPDTSEAIRHVSFPPEACAVIWLMLFILPNATVAKWHVMFMCCLSSPDASKSIRHVLFPPEACAAIWLMLFILPNATVAK